MKRLIRGLYFIVCSTILLSTVWFTIGANDSFMLIPEEKNPGTAPNRVNLLSDPAGEGKTFRSSYEKYGNLFTDEKDLWWSLASWVVTRDTILLMLIQVVKFIANMALVVGAAMIIYAGYIYVMAVYAGDNTSKANEAIKDAALGIVIVIFSYAIQRIVTQAFLS